MRRSLEGKTALVTGGAQRIGRAIVLALARSGAHCVIHYNRSSNEAEALAAECEKLGVNAHTCGADLSDPIAVEALAKDAVAKAGSLEILVNSASIFPSDTFASMSRESLSENLEVNAMAPLALARAFAAQCRDGDVVNLLDTRVVDHDRDHASYHVSKRMLHTFTKLMAVELAPEIRVNAVAPGLVLPPPGKDMSYVEALTGTNPLKTHGDADDVADAAIFLLTAGFITGQIIFVDGGRNLLGGLYD